MLFRAVLIKWASDWGVAEYRISPQAGGAVWRQGGATDR
jgi:hypothetical protein